ncbi:protein of unknown function [Rhodovastum atsumiense]|nr:protein of unknown function [Rhodovastum atsumiense]
MLAISGWLLRDNLLPLALATATIPRTEAVSCSTSHRWPVRVLRSAIYSRPTGMRKESGGGRAACHPCIA